ncbi:MAG: 2-dehydro-3-deoxygalactonokinase [Rhodobacteraceae bacterium]|nr:2-dehydro-3-deoxygalactonokinase [Paracoccaceae bacterium]
MTSNRIAADWIAADWGTSNLRLWAIGPGGEILAERSAPEGMGTLAPDQFEPALLRLAEDLLAPDRVTPVLICGMAGAKQGWIEAPYARVPCPPASGAPVTAPTADPRISVRILPGLSQSGPADVMRGEETQIAGFLADEPEFDGTLCLPGTHTKWVRIAGGEVRGFRTAMTGELFALIGRQSVLRHSLSPDGETDETAFAEALRHGFAEPAALSLDLFSIRPASLLDGLAPAAASGRLSGLLIGLELAGARDFWQGRDVVVVGTPGLTARYIAALEQLGGRARAAANPELARSGLVAAYRVLQG